jgi:hypothetical protein
MVKKKAKGKTAKTKQAKKSSGNKSKKGKKELNPIEVRKEIAQMVDAEATEMAEAVIGEGLKGQLATVKYLFEVADIYPAPTDGSQSTTDEDSLAQTLLNRLNIPDKPIRRDEEDEPVASSVAGTSAGKEEKPSDKLQDQQEGSESEANGEESKHVSALV